MCDAGVARKRDEAVWMDADGNIVDNPSMAFGCKVTHDFIPICVLFVMTLVET